MIVNKIWGASLIIVGLLIILNYFKPFFDLNVACHLLGFVISLAGIYIFMITKKGGK